MFNHRLSVASLPPQFGRNSDTRSQLAELSAFYVNSAKLDMSRNFCSSAKILEKFEVVYGSAKCTVCPTNPTVGMATALFARYVSAPVSVLSESERGRDVCECHMSMQ